MSTWTSVAEHSPGVAIGRVSNARILMREVRMECLRLLRTPAFSIPTILFPAMFYSLFGVLRSHGPTNPMVAAHTLAMFMMFGTIAPGLFRFGVSLAVERDRGLLQLKRALPVPPWIHLGAKVAMATAFSTLVFLLLLVIGLTLGHVNLSVGQCIELFTLALFAVLPFCALGLWLGTLVKGSAAPALINVLYLPMSFLSGMLAPLSTLPHPVTQIAPLWPTYHLAQVAAIIVGTSKNAALFQHLLVLVVYGVGFFAAASRRLQKMR